MHKGDAQREPTPLFIFFIAIGTNLDILNKYDMSIYSKVNPYRGF